ncbi:MAG: hypothetical protein ACI9FJ_000853, partial [Alteromonadaceae bacterium]
PQALANNLSGPDSFKLFVIKGAVASKSIVKGDYADSADKLASLGQSKQQSATQLYETAMSSCVTNVHINKLTAAIEACDNAVAAIDSVKRRTIIKHKYKALALNNRAIAKHFNHDTSGAYQDFAAAKTLNNNSLISDNLDRFSMQLINNQLAVQTSDDTQTDSASD